MLALFSCGTEVTESSETVYSDEVHQGDYAFVSLERENIKKTDLVLDFDFTSELRMVVVYGRPEEVYGDNYRFYGSRTRPIYGDSLSLVVPESHNCYFFINCTLADYFIFNTPLGGTPFTFAISAPGEQYLIPMTFSFSKIDNFSSTLRLTVTVQSYRIVFEG